ncbi:hypothetical protein DPMN_170025 [Dreissena polymorpha]|uniref:Uncharacterized protein n=1 Tax=Dreissena polymorpha TaxID=45954 RepID=A0A9D4DYR9_DREPO|nr:hypothetical protein DPMN_170025 [Dreissena polymorpha]
MDESPNDLPVSNVDRLAEVNNFRYGIDCHSKNCSINTLSVVILPIHDQSFLTPAYSGRSGSSTAT